MEVLDDEVSSAIANAFNILRERFDRFGVVQPNITQLATKGRILIELPGQKDKKRVRELLQGTANLEFWETYENGEIISYLVQANDILKSIQANELKPAPSADVTEADSTIAVAVDTTSKEDQALLDLLSAFAGASLTADDVTALGKKVLKLEREFNEKAGFSKKDDRLPEFFKKQALPPHNVKWTITNDKGADT